MGSESFSATGVFESFELNDRKNQSSDDEQKDEQADGEYGGVHVLTPVAAAPDIQPRRENRRHPQPDKHASLFVWRTDHPEPQSDRKEKRDERRAENQVVLDFEHPSAFLNERRCGRPHSEPGITPSLSASSLESIVRTVACVYWGRITRSMT